MDQRDQSLAWLAELRAWARDPLAVMYVVMAQTGRRVIFPEDVDGKSDQELLALVRERCNK